MVETVETRPGTFGIQASVRRLGVYLDNFALIELAKGDVDRRDRLIRAFHNGADLMFSPANAAEVVGPNRQSSIDAVREFLNAVGPYWFPVEAVDLVSILEREAAGASRSDACLSRWFIQQFFAARSIQVHGEQRQGLVGPDYFQLGFVLDWLGPQRDNIRSRVEAFDTKLSAKLVQFRSAYEQNPRGFQVHVPEPKWDRARPADFTWNGLVRTLVLEAKAFRFKKGDAIDLCHAVASAAFANFATLDKQWKRRVENLPRPNECARVYNQPELDRLVEDVERAVA